MFERRLKILLSIVFGLAIVMFVRAVQLQVFQKQRWLDRANDAQRPPAFVDAPRGRILDRNGIPIAYDEACLDAAVDYRAIALDPDWIKAQARARLRGRAEAAVSAAGVTREQLLADEVERVKANVDAMWQKLADVSGKNVEEIEQTRQEVLRRVLLLRRNAWYRRFVKTSTAATQSAQEGSRWYRWLVDARQDDPDKQRDAQLDAAAITVGEQAQSHVILENLSNDQQIALRKILPECPGLELRESTHRMYDPQAAVVAAHLLGRLTPVDANDVKSDANAARGERRKYLPRDMIGRAGLEGLAEPVLRGGKGKLVRTLGSRDAIEISKPQPGRSAMCSIDLTLQADVLESFKTLSTYNKAEMKEEIYHDLHGAVVAIDVPTNEVLVMASYPTFDMNRYESDYAALSRDDVNGPLLNRATMAQHEPGSTVKTIIGAVAVTRGVIRYDKGLECTGYLVIPDRRTGQMIRIRGTNRCWVASQFEHQLQTVAHHPVPFEAPHRGRYGNPDGFLVLSDALERSCNVYFQTVADMMHLDGVTEALSLFGLGQRTGIGIPEATGRVPEVHPPLPGAKFESDDDRRAAWLAGIGQGQVIATPIQMANVAATLARGGIWMRPRLLTDEAAREVYNSGGPDDVRDLHLSPVALAAVKEGMIAVVNGPAGTGEEPKRPDLLVAAKTGSAQAAKFSIPMRDPRTGELLREPGPDGAENKGRVLRQVFEPGAFPWYQGVGENHQHLAHAWFIGYVPADKPKIAFCVFVEYGGSGGKVAGAIARQLIEACVQHKYLSPQTSGGGLATR